MTTIPSPPPHAPSSLCVNGTCFKPQLFTLPQKTIEEIIKELKIPLPHDRPIDIALALSVYDLVTQVHADLKDHEMANQLIKAVTPHIEAFMRQLPEGVKLNKSEWKELKK